MCHRQFEILPIILNGRVLKSCFQVNAISWSGEELDSCSYKSLENIEAGHSGPVSVPEPQDRDDSINEG